MVRNHVNYLYMDEKLKKDIEDCRKEIEPILAKYKLSLQVIQELKINLVPSPDRQAASKVSEILTGIK